MGIGGFVPFFSSLGTVKIGEAPGPGADFLASAGSANIISKILIAARIALPICSRYPIDVGLDTQSIGYQCVDAYDIVVHGLDPVIQCHDDSAETFDAAHDAS